MDIECKNISLTLSCPICPLPLTVNPTLSRSSSSSSSSSSSPSSTSPPTSPPPPPPLPSSPPTSPPLLLPSPPLPYSSPPPPPPPRASNIVLSTCSSARLSTCPYHFNLFSVMFSVTGATYGDPHMFVSDFTLDSSQYRVW